MLLPPPQLRNATMALVEDEVSVFGNKLTIRAAPYSEQDGEFLRCAHSAIWACHYSAYRRGLVGRRLTAELAELAPALLSAARSLPSPGMTLEQIQAVFDATGQPALLYGMNQLPEVRGVENPPPKIDPTDPDKKRILPAGLWDTRLFSVICRYLNSGFPVLIANARHAWVLVGWFKRAGQIRFVACDDQQGPYEVVQSPFTDKRKPWLAIMVPLPPKVFMSGEMAENWGHRTFRAFGQVAGVPPSWAALSQALASLPKGVSLRTFLRDGREYKAGLALAGPAGRGRPPASARSAAALRLGGRGARPGIARCRQAVGAGRGRVRSKLERSPTARTAAGRAEHAGRHLYLAARRWQDGGGPLRRAGLELASAAPSEIGPAGPRQTRASTLRPKLRYVGTLGRRTRGCRHHDDPRLTDARRSATTPRSSGPLRTCSAATTSSPSTARSSCPLTVIRRLDCVLEPTKTGRPREAQAARRQDREP